MSKKTTKGFGDFLKTIHKKVKVFGTIMATKDGTTGSKRKDIKPPTGMKIKAEEISIDMSLVRVAKVTIVILLMLALFSFVQNISGVLLIFFISFLLAAALDPLVDRMQGLRIPRSLSMIIIYVVLFFLLGVFITGVVTLVADQVAGIAASVGQWVSEINKGEGITLPFAKYLQPYLDQLLQTIDLQDAAAQLQNALILVKDQLYNLTIGFFNLIIVLTLTFFMTVEEKSIDNFFLSLFPSKYATYISSKMEDVKDQIGLWLRGQLFVSLEAALVSYIGLVLMGVDYALTLALIAGIAMVIPVVGRFVAWLITFPIVLNQSPALALGMSVFYLLWQQLENNILVPKIMNKAVGLSPIILIFAMMVGWQFLDFIGLIFSIPIATTVSIFVKDYTQRDK